MGEVGSRVVAGMLHRALFLIRGCRDFVFALGGLLALLLEIFVMSCGSFGTTCGGFMALLVEVSILLVEVSIPLVEVSACLVQISVYLVEVLYLL